MELRKIQACNHFLAACPGTGFPALLAALLIALPAFAAPRTYALVYPTEGLAGIRFDLLYSSGTHRGSVGEARGEVTFDPSAPGGAKAHFTVPIRGIKTGDETRDCHMREALGLDYARSGFPEEHVCRNDDSLPETGPDAIVFPDLALEVRGVRSAEKAGGGLGSAGTGAAIPLDRPSRVEVTGEWRIHGKQKPARVEMELEPRGDGLRLLGKTRLSLKDFGIVVKDAKILFLTIRVEDSAEVSLDLFFRQR